MDTERPASRAAPGFLAAAAQRLAFIVALVAGWRPVSSQEALQKDLGDTDVDRLWVYDDWEGARDLAAREGKPILAVFRCVP